MTPMITEIRDSLRLSLAAIDVWQAQCSEGTQEHLETAAAGQPVTLKRERLIKLQAVIAEHRRDVLKTISELERLAATYGG